MKNPADLFAPYDPDACVRCGRCLSECPVMGLDPKEAEWEIRELKGGGNGRHVLSRCETCFSCSVRCENGANPASLFQQRFYEYYTRRGHPAWSAYFQPYEPGNYRQQAIDLMGRRDRALVRSWKSTEPVEEFLYPGCNLTSVPWMLEGAILGDLPVRGGMHVCCGETLFRMGMFDHLKQNARRLDAWLDRLGAKRMYLLCTAGVNMFTNVLPRYGLKSKVEIVPYLPILRDRIRSGAIEITKPLDLTVTLQESCYGKVLGPDYYAVPREILGAIGVRVVEMPHCKETSYCCGIGAGFPVKSGYNPVKMIAAARRVLGEAKRTGAGALATYCAGCWMMLSAMRVFSPTAMPVVHVVELLRRAMGETPRANVANRMLVNLTGPMIHQFPRLASGKRIFKDPIPTDID